MTDGDTRFRQRERLLQILLLRWVPDIVQGTAPLAFARIAGGWVITLALRTHETVDHVM